MLHVTCLEVISPFLLLLFALKCAVVWWPLPLLTYIGTYDCFPQILGFRQCCWVKPVFFVGPFTNNKHARIHLVPTTLPYHLHLLFSSTLWFFSSWSLYFQHLLDLCRTQLTTFITGTFVPFNVIPYQHVSKCCVYTIPAWLTLACLTCRFRFQV